MTILAGFLTQAEFIEILTRPGFLQVLFNVYQFIAMAWFIVLFTIAARISQGLSWRKAIPVAVLAVAVVGVLIVVFIR
ncbi:MAG: hypothetical protein AB1597_05135 [Chloroflexota bacterium]